jgi:hypothetical protein
MPSSPSSSPWPSTATAASPNSRSDVHLHGTGSWRHRLQVV